MTQNSYDDQNCQLEAAYSFFIKKVNFFYDFELKGGTFIYLLERAKRFQYDSLQTLLVVRYIFKILLEKLNIMGAAKNSFLDGAHMRYKGIWIKPVAVTGCKHASGTDNS